YLIGQLAEIPAVEVHPCTEVAAGTGNGHLERLTLRHSPSGKTWELDAEWLFVFIGAEPGTGWLPAGLARDPRGFVLTGPDLGGRPPGWPLDRDPYHLETSLPGVFAAGDVRAESIKRVASAVGDGAMAVALVHRSLEQRCPPRHAGCRPASCAPCSCSRACPRPSSASWPPPGTWCPCRRGWWRPRATPAPAATCCCPAPSRCPSGRTAGTSR